MNGVATKEGIVRALRELPLVDLVSVSENTDTHSVTVHVSTHTFQDTQAARQVEAEASEFLESMRPAWVQFHLVVSHLKRPTTPISPDGSFIERVRQKVKERYR